MVSFASPGLIGGPRTTTVSQISGLTAAGAKSNELEGQLQILKLQQAIAAAKSGQGVDNSPAGLQAARLKAALEQQQGAAGSNQTLQTQRLQYGQSSEALKVAAQKENLGAQLAAQMAQLQTRQGGDRSLQGDRIQSSEKINTQNLAAQLQRQNVGIQGQKDLQTDASNLEEKRRQDAAARALALFRSTPGGNGQKLNLAGARSELA